MALFWQPLPLLLLLPPMAVVSVAAWTRRVVQQEIVLKSKVGLQSSNGCRNVVTEVSKPRVVMVVVTAIVVNVLAAVALAVSGVLLLLALVVGPSYLICVAGQVP